MKRKMILFLAILICFTVLFTVFMVNLQAAGETITSNETGTHGGYDYELWKDKIIEADLSSIFENTNLVGVLISHRVYANFLGVLILKISWRYMQF